MIKILASKFAKTIQVNKLLFLFSLFWLSGLVLGMYSAASMFHNYVPLLHDVASGKITSFFQLCLVVFYPWIFSLFLYRIPAKLPFMLFIAAKAFTFSFIAYAALLTFSTAGWLVRYLLLFSSAMSVLAYLRCWICCVCNCLTNKIIVQSAVFLIAVVCMDFWIISPYLFSLF